MELMARIPAADKQEKAASRADLLSTWYDDYGTLILRTCYLYLGSRTEAEDALQETLLKAWRHMDRDEARCIGNEKTWLLRIAVNTCRDILRTPWRRRIDHAVRLDELPQLQAVSNSDRDLLLDVMALPARYREVILLYYYHGMTTKEVSFVLNTSESTVSRRMAKACQLLHMED